MFKLLPFLVAAGLVLAGAPSAVAGAPPPVLDWQPCEPAGFECATAEVPRDHARPQGAKLELAMIRWPAGDRENRIGSLFLNPGGPGGSGVRMVREAPRPALAAFGRLYDIVGVDPRGVGASRPAVQDCGVRYQGDQYLQPETLDREAVVRTARDQLRRCDAASGGILPYLTTANVARDFDLLRAAVGDAQVQLLRGLLRRRDRGALHVAVPGPDGGDGARLSGGRRRLVQPAVRGHQRAARELRPFARPLAALVQPPRGDLRARSGGSPRRLRSALVAQLNAAPVPVLSDPSQPPVNGDEVLGVFLDGVYSRFNWAPLAAALTRLGKATAARSASSSGPSTTTRDVHRRLLRLHGQRGALRGGADRFLREKEHTFGLSDRFGWARGYEWVGLTLWPFEPRGSYRGPFRHAPGAQPVLVIGGTHDPATPYRWAKRVVSDLGNARLLTYRSDGHGAITDLNGCIVGRSLAYLETGALPEEGASCRQAVADPAALRSAGQEELRAWKRTTVPALR